MGWCSASAGRRTGRRRPALVYEQQREMVRGGEPEKGGEGGARRRRPAWERIKEACEVGDEVQRGRPGVGWTAAGAGVLGRHEQGSLAPVEAEEKRGGGCGIGWIEGRRKVAVVGSMWNSRRILERALVGGLDEGDPDRD